MNRRLVAACLVPLALAAKDCGATAQPATSRTALAHQGFNFTTWSSDEYASARAARVAAPSSRQRAQTRSL